MATKAIYITVRLDVENPTANTISDEEINDLVSEMDYSFHASENSSLTIVDTEICGRND
ncbi:hypothetical protein [Alistipes sp. i18-0019-D1]|uniref:hypothetical protein n=1 Tax=Alistipes sp. i18-0019-D1 TaxID=3132707 RepID=UPI0036F44AD6